MKKRILTLAMATALTVAMSVSALAAATDCPVATTEEGLATGWSVEGELVDAGVQKKGELLTMGLKVKVDGAEASTYQAGKGLKLTFTTEKAGKYDITFNVAGPAERGFAYSIDNGAAVDKVITTGSSDYATNSAEKVAGVELTAGTHTIVITVPTTYKNPKSVNVVGVSYELKEEAATPTADNNNDATPATDDKKNDTATKTGDFNYAILAVFGLAAIAGVVVTKKKVGAN